MVGIMTLDCNNIKLTKGTKNDKVKEAQKLLKDNGYYTGVLDGDYGDMTVNAVKSFQKAKGLSVDGWIGPVTCQKLNSTVKTASYYSNGVYVSSPHWTASGCNKLGQCNGYYCGPHSIRQCLAKQNIDNYTEYTIAGYAGTTSAGTGHGGLETAIAKIAKLTGKKIKVEWFNFSDLGSSTTERFKKLGTLISTQNKSVFIHLLYQYKYGHYETIKEVNMNNNTVLVLNSLGSKCNSPAFCGKLERRSFSTMVGYMKGISQKSICILTFE